MVRHQIIFKIWKKMIIKKKIEIKYDNEMRLLSEKKR
jgi:DNA polymerase III sliding clamp (beta) subunit (PCNA family)